ncbi:MAG: TetR/AcrR family transcriptional regulator [Bacteroidales bacterium]
MEVTSNPKRKQILAHGKELFWKFGFKRVSIEEICRAAGVSKMTFYKFFPNKLELAKTILDEILDESIQEVRRISDEHESTAKTLRKIMQMKSKGSRDISEEFIKDLYATPDTGLKTFIEEKTNSMFAEVARIYEKGKEDGWIRKDLNIPFFMTFTLKLIPIYSDDEILHFFESSQELIMEITNLFVYGVSPHD